VAWHGSDYSGNTLLHDHRSVEDDFGGRTF
jgi:hypothetical protein